MMHKSLQKHKPHIEWPAVYFAAEANREPFRDVHVVTLKSHFIDLIRQQAFIEVGLDNDSNFQQEVIRLISTTQLKVSEHVLVDRGEITIVVNCEQIDDEAIFPALDLLSEALDYLNGSDGRIDFGEPVAFYTTELPTLYVH